MTTTPKVTGAPAVIWLVYGDIDRDDKHSNFQEVTWCEDSQYDSDVKYVRADEVERLRAGLQRAARGLEKLGADEDDISDAYEALEQKV